MFATPTGNCQLCPLNDTPLRETLEDVREALEVVFLVCVVTKSHLLNLERIRYRPDSQLNGALSDKEYVIISNVKCAMIACTTGTFRLLATMNENASRVGPPSCLGL